MDMGWNNADVFKTNLNMWYIEKISTNFAMTNAWYHLSRIMSKINQ